MLDMKLFECLLLAGKRPLDYPGGVVLLNGQFTTQTDLIKSDILAVALLT